jgi:hypothetical protein
VGVGILSRRSEFQIWLTIKTSESSAYKYSRAINTISDWMIAEEVIEQNIYTITSGKELAETTERIKSYKCFINKNKVGHNMYSCALNHYYDFFTYQ